jgi:hypothetical protein
MRLERTQSSFFKSGAKVQSFQDVPALASGELVQIVRERN